MPTEAAVLEALRPVEDPELHQSIVDLDMVKEVAIDGGRVAVTVALTVSGCPLKPEITRRVSEAVQPLDGVDSVDVDLTVMDDEQRQGIAERLRQQHAGAAAADGRPARVNPFTDARTRVLAVASGKGGVGKSSVTTTPTCGASRCRACSASTTHLSCSTTSSSRPRRTA